MITTMTKRALGIAAVLLALLIVAPATVASASTTVSVPCSGSGGGAAGLVNAITATNGAGGGIIDLAEGCTYSLTSANNGSNAPMASGANGLPVVTSTISLLGSDTTIAANNTDFRVLEVDGPGGNLTLQGLTITGGNSGFGGGILNVEGSVALDQSVVTGNTGQMGGGGIASGIVNPNHLGPIGTLTLTSSQVDNNTALSSGGGGILNHAGTLALYSSQVDDNTSGGGGGGIASGPGNGGSAGSSTLTLYNSEVNSNTSTGGPMAGGGGIANGGAATITDSQVASNVAPGADGGGILNHGQMTIESSYVFDNSAPSDGNGNNGNGGGIANVNLGVVNSAPNSGVLVIDQSQVVNNSASGVGGGIVEGGVNPTGAFAIPGGPLTLTSSQVTNNTSGSGGGIYSNVGSLVTIANTSVGGNKTSDCAGATGNAWFICATYEDLLGRAPEASGLAYWLAMLSEGASRTQVVYDIATSPEYRQDFVSGFYEAYLGRGPDAGGLSYWVGQLKSGVSDAQVLAGILGSAEFYRDAGSTAPGFVTALYADLLGRAPDPAGLSGWTSLLASGSSRSAVAAGVVTSNEFLLNLLGNEYLDLLDSAPGAAGLSFWVSQLQGGTAFEWVIAGIVGSPEFYSLGT